MPRTPANLEEFAATCEVLPERGIGKVEVDRLKGVAKAMQPSVVIDWNDGGASS